MKKKLKTHQITSLPPGFLVITYDPYYGDPQDFRIGQEEWNKLLELGYTGGIIVCEGTKIETLSDKELNDLGLCRIEKDVNYVK